MSPYARPTVNTSPATAFHPPSFAREPRWHPATGWHLRKAPGELQPWLVSKDSLTQRLIKASEGHFQVQLLVAGWQRPQHNECRLLGLGDDEYAFVRQVYLLGREQVWVYARSVIPHATTRGPLKSLTRLGNRPLGEILFTNPRIRRGRLQIARIVPGQAMYNEASRHGELSRSPLWGRRSLFWLQQHPLLVSEIFLPAIAETQT